MLRCYQEEVTILVSRSMRCWNVLRKVVDWHSLVSLTPAATLDMFRFQFSNIRKEQLHLQVIETRAHYRVYFCVFYHGNLAQYVLFGTWETSYKNAHKNKLYTRKCHGRPTFGVDKNVIWRCLVWRCFCFCLFCPPGLFDYLCLVKVLWLDFVFSLFCFIFWRHSYTCLFSSKNKDLSAVPDLMVLQRGYYT